MSRVADTLTLPSVVAGRAAAPRGPAVCFVVLWLFVLAAGRERMFSDPGTFWHPVVGRQILSGAGLPRVDLFSAAHLGERWIAQQWFGEAILALLERAAGRDGLLLAAVTLLAGVYAWGATRLQRAGLPWMHAALACGLVIAASSYHFLIRPHLFSLLLMAAMVALLADVEAGRAGPRRLLWIPPLIALWSNLHGAALGGVATLWLVIGGWSAARLLPITRRTAPLDARGLAIAWLTLALATLAPLANPYGVELPRSWIRLMSTPQLPGLIVEHAPLSLREPAGWFVLLLAAAFGVQLCRCGVSRLRVTHFVPIVWFVLALGRIRHGPLFAIAAMFLVPLHERPVGEEDRRIGSLAPVVALTLLASFCLSRIATDVIGVDAIWSRLSPQTWPSAATAATLNRRLADEPVRATVINDMIFGGWLIDAVPRARVFIDDRCELYPVAEMLDYEAAATREPARIDAWADRLAARFALVQRNGRFAAHLAASPRWRELAADPACRLFERIDY